MISELCLCDLQGNVEVVLRHDGHIEAPNWHPDGYLIVNGDGTLFRVPLDSPGLVPIDTGFATACNNDHGLSPDGKTLVICDKTRTEASCIYALPVTGGTPQRITKEVPSWWHGWAPDGTRLAYAGARDGGPVTLFTCAVDGSDERQITHGFDHVDGPDYTPDGAWIWFNGEREGRVDLWRIRPDGSDAERMTDGEDVDWFPHPSPDGAHVVWLAYPPGTAGHPFGLDVRLRIMASDGTGARDLVSLFGGQGTINVPSWSPDSARFAFMRYLPNS